MFKKIANNAVEAGIICFVGLAFGLVVNFSSIKKVIKEGAGGGVRQIATSCSANAVYARPIGLKEAQKMSESGAVLIDARPWEVYMEEHIPGAMSVSIDAAATAIPTLESNIPKDASIVVYCSGGQDCSDSEDLGKCLVDEGYENVKIFTGGMAEWKASGLPVN